MAASSTGPRNITTGWTDGPNGGKMHLDQEPAATLERPAPTEAKISTLCNDAGLRGIMPGVFGVLLDRDENSQALDNLTEEDVSEIHEDYIGPALDDTEKWIQRFGLTSPPTPEVPSAEATTNHINSICVEAGLEGVMPGLIEALIERHEGDETFVRQLNALTDYDMENMYNNCIAPAIDRTSERLDESHCVECGARSVDDDNYWKFCAVCGGDNNEIISNRDAH